MAWKHVAKYCSALKIWHPGHHQTDCWQSRVIHVAQDKVTPSTIRLVYGLCLGASSTWLRLGKDLGLVSYRKSQQCLETKNFFYYQLTKITTSCCRNLITDMSLDRNLWFWYRTGPTLFMSTHIHPDRLPATPTQYTNERNIVSEHNPDSNYNCHQKVTMKTI